MDSLEGGRLEGWRRTQKQIKVVIILDGGYKTGLEDSEVHGGIAANLADADGEEEGPGGLVTRGEGGQGVDEGDDAVLGDGLEEARRTSQGLQAGTECRQQGTNLNHLKGTVTFAPFCRCTFGWGQATFPMIMLPPILWPNLKCNIVFLQLEIGALLSKTSSLFIAFNL